MKRTFVFGDIHGCYEEMMALYKTLCKVAHLDPHKDIVGFVGDYVDRGPNSNKVVEQLIKWNKRYPHWFFLYGNHEDLMLDALVHGGKTYGSYDLWWQQGGKQTAQSYFPSGMSKYDMAISQPKDRIKPGHLEWLKNLPFYHQDEKYFYVHAGVVPGSKLKMQTDLLQEGYAEIRNCFLWARGQFIDSDYHWSKKIIFGHTADSSGKYHPDKRRFEPIIMDNKIGLDTAVCPPANRSLTAIELPKEKIYSQISFERIKMMQKFI